MEVNYRQALQRAHYRLIGPRKHSAIAVCHWTKESIVRDRVCYKQEFYGIQSHRCLQLTPCITCMQRCIYCWRPVDLSPLEWRLSEYDEPGIILEEAINQQRKLLEGYGGLLQRINRKKFGEAQEPNQVAISLAGEPTIYPKIGELIRLCKNRGMTTFLVSNGMLPEVIGSLECLPTQLYVSLAAPDKGTHRKINNPMLSDSWERLNRTLEIMGGLKTRRAIRITLIRGMNDFDSGNYAKMIEKAGADFVEVKSYMFVGYSRKRMKFENMMKQEEVRDFAERLGKETGYKISGEQPVSRVVVLSSGKKNLRI